MLKTGLTLLFATVWLTSSAYGRNSPQEPATSKDSPRVTLRCLREPLSEILKNLSKQAQIDLTAERDLSGQKLVLIIHDRPATEVRARIAELLGANWVTVGKPEDHQLRLERDPEVIAWLAFYARSRSLAEKYARAQQTKFVRDFMDRMIKGANDPEWKPPEGETFDRGLAKLLGTLPASLLDTVAQQFGDSSAVTDGGEYEESHSPVRFTPGELNAQQRQSMSSWIGNYAAQFSNDFSKSLRTSMDSLNVTISSTDGCSLEVCIRLPGEAEDETHRFPVFGQSYAPRKLEDFKKADLQRRLAGRPMPPKALLGARFGDNGLPTPAVSFDDKDAAGRPFNPFKSSRPFRWQLLADLADTLNLDVVADYYTSTTRLPDLPKEIELGQLLEVASKGFDTVVRVNGGCLLARRALWPDDDVLEPPAPLAEQWVDTKERHERLTFDDIAAMATLTNDQLTRLAIYQDPPVNFSPELGALRYARTQGRRSLLAMYANLPATVRKRIASERGTDLSTLPVALKDEIAHQIRLENATAASAARLHLYKGTTTFGNTQWEVFRLELLVPGQQPVTLLELTIGP